MTPPTTNESRPRIGISILLFNTPFQVVESTLRALDNSSRIGLTEERGEPLSIAIGDASTEPQLNAAGLSQLRESFSHLNIVGYDFFNKNLGFSNGHNRIVEQLGDCEFIVVANPDIVVEPRAVWHLQAAFADPRIGMAEAKQLPIEHPKEYQLGSGATDWSSGAFAMVRRELWEELGGMDGETFFMYCEDVDFSWRIREAGYLNVIQPAATVFHDKRLGNKGQWQPTNTEVRYSAASQLFLAHKWSRPRIVTKLLNTFENSGSAPLEAAAKAYRRREKQGTLPTPRDPDHRIGTFRNGAYAKHRFTL